jgi:hypothetical protein
VNSSAGIVAYSEKSVNSSETFTYVGVKGPGQGIVKITIDGVSTQVSLYSTSTLWKTEFYRKTGLTSKRHVVTIEWTGKAASGAKKSTTNINLDTITVY